MPLFTKRPVTVAAEQLATGPDYPESRDLVLAWVRRWNGKASIKDDKLVIETLEGDMTARPGDWVVRGVYGEFYPVDPGVFEVSYSPATAREIEAFQERM